ncbi:unnamed protein product [Kuraishia capsulata CBS 1993]|uniref:Phytanoyl-CoA dioxygenase n=1 Tax=Kuraishia capsulata CBS 1993 TaxID=1382522 RepID=W6MJ50_9ASCO|nr:uncharacterized protein KUCA_T00002227001 [Kuraishia capsulata CBS 1993]CDK26256.1 unnamed protein product [Kuraishia capsulata CBS 1993]
MPSSTATATANGYTFKSNSAGQIRTSKVSPKIFKEAHNQIYGQKHNDWRDDFTRDGYVVIKGVIPTERALGYRKRMLDYLKTFDNPELDYKDNSTWIAENLPAHNPHNIFFYYSCIHEDFAWEVRTEPGVLESFAKLWNTEELLVSFDGFNVSFPNRPDQPPFPAWPHIDQSPLKEGLQCAQGIVSLSKSSAEDGTLVVLKGSNNLVSEFFEKEVGRENWYKYEEDAYRFTQEEYNYFLEKGCEVVKVEVDPGDLIIWDSRTIHWGQAPTVDSHRIRAAVYASYTPRNFATDETLQVKADVFKHWLGTTHWAHDNIKPRLVTPILPDGSIDPRDRSEPKQPPELNDTILKLAGVIPY